MQRVRSFEGSTVIVIFWVKRDRVIHAGWARALLWWLSFAEAETP